MNHDDVQRLQRYTTVDLTTRLKSSNVCLYQSEYDANRVECSNTPHGSNPTLGLAVTGLRGIIHSRLTLVLRDFCSPTDSIVCWGCIVFRVIEVHQI